MNAINYNVRDELKRRVASRLKLDVSALNGYHKSKKGLGVINWGALLSTVVSTGASVYSSKKVAEINQKTAEKVAEIEAKKMALELQAAELAAKTEADRLAAQQKQQELKAVVNEFNFEKWKWPILGAAVGGSLLIFFLARR